MIPENLAPGISREDRSPSRDRGKTAVFRWPLSQAELRAFASAMASGGVAIVPTDTVYGVAAAPERRDALAAIIAAKGRDPGKPVQLLVASAECVEGLGLVLDGGAAALARAFWPGALTLVLPRRDGSGTEGVRVPDSEAARALCAAVGGALRCTSANRSGDPPALDFSGAMAALPGAAAAVDAGPAPGGVASTVAGVLPDGSLRLFRRGPISEEALRRVLASVARPTPR